MKKLLLTLMLAVVSSSAMADWVEAGSYDGRTVYANIDKIRKSGNKAKMWHLIDYDSVQELTGGKVFINNVAK